MNWIQEITEEDLPQEFGGLAKIIGLENVIKTIQYFEGGRAYFPKMECTFKNVRDKVIRRKWRKHNIRELAREFNLSENRIREIANDHEDQLDLLPPRQSFDKELWRRALTDRNRYQRYNR